MRKILIFEESERIIPPPAQCRGRILDFGRVRVMGVINATPDSFSDGGRHGDPSAALDAIARMTEEGADIIDIGGESTRPGSEGVEVPEELQRVMPIIDRLNLDDGPLISIDTCKPAVARAALDAGVHIVNDVRGFIDPEMRQVVAEVSAAAIAMHMKGDPRTMQDAPEYADVVREVAAVLDDRAAAVEGAGVQSVMIDPGIGFGKTWNQNLEILRDIPVLTRGGRPVVVGVSRKAFIGKATGVEQAGERLIGTKVVEAFAVCGGADIIRTHDVREALEGIRMAEAFVRGTVMLEPYEEVY